MFSAYLAEWQEKQAHVYLEGSNYAYAHFIASSIVFSGTNYSDWYIADYPK